MASVASVAGRADVYAREVPARLRPAPVAEVEAALARRRDGQPTAGDERLLVKHFLALLTRDHPGSSVEVRVPPYAVVQCVEGSRHTRGTPPAVVETDAATWIALATGTEPWTDVVRAGRLVASGERSDLSALLPLHSRPSTVPRPTAPPR